MMKKLTALFVASTLALGAANLAHAADTTTAPSDSKPMMMEPFDRICPANKSHMRTLNQVRSMMEVCFAMVLQG